MPLTFQQALEALRKWHLMNYVAAHAIATPNCVQPLIFIDKTANVAYSYGYVVLN